MQSAHESLAANSGRGALAKTVHALARATLAAARVPVDVADDLASEVTLAAVERIAAGAVVAGREDAYVRACARNRARDLHRGRSGVFVAEGKRAAADIELATGGADAESLLVELEEARARAERVRLVREAVLAAPPAYRALLDAVYVRGVAIESLVDAELEARATRGEVPPRRRVRNAIDKTLERARRWVRARVLSQLEATL